jgi:hypothetical protein
MIEKETIKGTKRRKKEHKEGKKENLLRRRINLRRN